MRYNEFDGLIPMEVFNISELEILDLTGNNLSGGLPADLYLGGVSRLQVLYLSSNELGGLIPSAISQCSELQLLSLSNNTFSGLIPKDIGNLTALEILYLSWNYLTGTLILFTVICFMIPFISESLDVFL